MATEVAKWSGLWTRSAEGEEGLATPRTKGVGTGSPKTFRLVLDHGRCRDLDIEPVMRSLLNLGSTESYDSNGLLGAAARGLTDSRAFCLKPEERA